MKKLGLILIAGILLAACGDDGDDGPATMTFDAVPAIITVDFTEIGAFPDANGFYFVGQVYGLTPGTGNIFWADASTTWFAIVTIEPGTQGDDAPLEGLLLQDGDDGRERRYTFFFFQGSFTDGNTLLSAPLPAPTTGEEAPTNLYPIYGR